MKATVRSIEIKDFYEGSTLTVEEWLKRTDEPELKKWEKFMSACDELFKHKDWDYKLRTPPRIGYDYEKDCEYFIFKLDNNGLTFVVHP